MPGRLVLVARILAGVVLVALASAVGASSVLAGRSPEAALAFWPASAEARAELSSQVLAENPISPDLARVRELARGALAREPVESTAAVSLAIAAISEGEREAGTRAYEYAERLSRRNSGAQLLLIEERVAENDIAGALVHYDRALRVSPRAGDVLLPVLVAAAGNAPVAEALAPFLQRRPPWWRDFLDLLAAEGSPGAIAAGTRAAALDPAEPAERVRLAASLQRLAQAGELDDAWALFREARPPVAGEALIRGGSFEEEPALYPFEWWFASEADLAAVREPREGAEGRFALSLIRDGGRTGELANQLLLLEPGSYRLTGRAGSISGDERSRPRLLVRCAASEARLGEIVLPEAPEYGAAFAGRFTVPAGCLFVWLGIAPSSGVDDPAGSEWIDDLALARS